MHIITCIIIIANYACTCTMSCTVMNVQYFFPCRLEGELKSLSDQLSAAPKQHQLESLQSAMSTVQASLQQAKEQLQQREEAAVQLNEKLVQVHVFKGNHGYTVCSEMSNSGHCAPC